MSIKAFFAASSELQAGVNLIEASAGTGKTYAIAMLVLRFVVEQGLDIKKLLVVTFTKAATEELKDRIRKRLAAAKQALQSPAAETDADLRLWLDGLPLDEQIIGQRLGLALLDIDQAAIFTIHGFCQRVLTEHALESGQMFDCELSGDIAAIRQNCADDFWRKQLYQRPLWQVALLTAVFPTPDQLLMSLGGTGLQQTVYPQAGGLDGLFDKLQILLAEADHCLHPLLHALQYAFQGGLFNDSYIRTVAENSDVLIAWLADPNSPLTDFSWLTSQGLMAGLNGRKFMVSKSKPLPSVQQKQQYLLQCGLDGGPFDALAAALQELQVLFRCKLLQTLNAELDIALQQNNVLSFDDLISRLYQALSGPKADLLISELQQRFAVALIDEFQDTDHQQWRIFSRIFATPEHYLYLIGDPKQAIYKFRGADIYSYFAAQEQASQRYTLLQNWRSNPDLVAGVNRLFQRQQPFFLPKLEFNPVQAAHNALDGWIEGGAPLVLWQLDKHPGNLEHWTAGKASAALRDAVVNEMLALLGKAVLHHGKQGSRVVQPKDIAVLVRSNSQAVEYQQALNAVGIPAVINSKQSVFTAPQAMELYTVLQAIAQPGHIPALKQALTVSWFNLDGQQFYSLSEDEAELDAWLSRFQDYFQLWQERGLLTMLQTLLQQELVEVHLCTQVQAERALTNLHHIIERLQQAAIDEHLTINKTLDWLHFAILHAAQDSSEDRQLRLESDEDAVKIVTLHSSKGLEYPLVFCLSLWQRNDRLKNEKNLIQCHENGEMIADLGSERFSERRDIALSEELAEDLRLLYVAVTRAQYRCYIAWADVRSKEQANDSALAYLLEFADGDFAAQQKTLKALLAEQPQSFAYQLLPVESVVSGHYQRPDFGCSLSYRRQSRSLKTHWQMSSYTALSALSLHDAPELPEDKAEEIAAVDIVGALVEEALELESVAEALPRGAQMGNVVHSLLEHNSFQRLAAGVDNKRVCEQALSEYGLASKHADLLESLLQTVVSAPLSANLDFRLDKLDEKQCLKEMPFYLAMQDVDVVRINRILVESPAYQALSSKHMCGYLTGFIDLICEYQGKYFVMDYKTNSLPDYRPATLLQAMRQHNYGLQYWLYSLVLHRYLQQRLAGYEYGRHFGGVKYLFVRGMRVDAPGVGVFADLPDEGAIDALGGVFFGDG